MSKESNDIFSALSKVTKEWKAEKRKADKDDMITSYSRFYRSYKVTIKDAAFSVMEEAYNKASSNGKYWANARQIFYAARPLILKQIEENKVESHYFQTLLKDYLEYYNPIWKVVWDARGHFTEPHTKLSIGIGGVEVLGYTESWSNYDFVGFERPTIDKRILTRGYHNRYKSVLFIEKEGFNEVLSEAKISERFDIAIMSTKGLPVKACCDLLSALESHVDVYVLHDFDKSGFTIVKTLREGTRMAQGVNVIDLGLRYEDLEGLESEPVYITGGYQEYYLRKCGATPEEIEFLIEKQYSRGAHGKRVELNAMISEDFIKWIETKLKKLKVKKVIPDEKILKLTYKRDYRYKEMEKFLEEKESEYEDDDDIEIEDDLKKQVKDLLKEKPELSWDEAVWEIVENNFE